MFEFIKTETYSIIFSFVIGIGIVAVFKPGCRDNGCAIKKAPPPNEVTKTTYRIADKCYKFTTKNITCPSDGVIEPFEINALRVSLY